MMRTSGGFGILAVGLAGAITVTGCAGTAEAERNAVAEDLNRWLGHYKEGLIVQIGPPAQCTPVPKGEGEVCEWRRNQGQLFYHYDARGIARSWTSTDPVHGQMEGVQNPADRQPSEGSVWRSVKEVLRDMNYGPTVGGGGR